jgi:hypothetical protein
LAYADHGDSPDDDCYMSVESPTTKPMVFAWRVLGMNTLKIKRLRLIARI